MNAEHRQEIRFRRLRQIAEEHTEEIYDAETRDQLAIQTLIHELAHHLIRVEEREEDLKLSYRVEEVVVESVAYSVCAGLGLDTSGDSVPYLAGWGGEEAADQLERYAQLIDRLAKRIEDALAEGQPAELEEEDI
jgi:hypothetical protein